MTTAAAPTRLDQGDLFAAQRARDEAIEQSDATVAGSADQSYLAIRAARKLIGRVVASGGRRFTADNVGVILDGMLVARTGPVGQELRKRIVSTVINRGARAKLWHRVGYVPSARRHCAPIAEWELDPRRALDALDGIFARPT